MMGLSLQLSLEQALRFELSLDLVGGASTSVFPEAERLLQQDGYAEALTEIAPLDIMDLYRSVMDFLACETFPQLREPCSAFYAGQGPPLRALATDSELALYERGLIKVLRAARKTRRRKYDAEFDEKWSSVLCAALL